MTIRRYSVAATIPVGGAGAVTAYSGVISGKIESIRYVKDAVNAYADGSTFTITADGSGESIWTETGVNASATRRPRAPSHNTAGVASLYAAGGTAVNDKVALGAEKIKIVVTAGGADGKTGTFQFSIDN